MAVSNAIDMKLIMQILVEGIKDGMEGKIWGEDLP